MRHEIPISLKKSLKLSLFLLIYKNLTRLENVTTNIANQLCTLGKKV